VALKAAAALTISYPCQTLKGAVHLKSGKSVIILIDLM